LQAVHLPDETAYFVGPLARINLNRDLLSPTARQLSNEVSIAWPCFNPYQSIVARAIEVVHAFEEALSIVANYQGCSRARAAYDYCNGEGTWATEAPRGLIYHRYRVNEDGSIAFAKIVPPTSQNQRQIELDLTAYLPQVLSDDDNAIARACERLIRSYDPCISCATHFLKLELVRR
ncbi:MAG: nickel-dependent hydrogenase large subunit, partial [Aureliella sp.]